MEKIHMLGESYNTVANAAATYNYRDTLAASQKNNWRIDDIIGGEKQLDFSKPFMPEALARTGAIEGFTYEEKRVLNQIKGHAYLSIFGIVEEFILPFILDHIRPSLDMDDYRVRAILQFAGEEAKHIQLFKTFEDEFSKGFPVKCPVIGPAAEIGAHVLSHSPLAVGLLILGIEWATQAHYLESIRDDAELDPLFKDLLKHHWMEEAQHAKLDTLMVEALAEGMTEAEIAAAVDGYCELGGFFDGGTRQQAILDIDTFEIVTGRKLTETERGELTDAMHQANRWTYLGSGMTHPRFLETLGKLSPAQRARIEDMAPAFC